MELFAIETGNFKIDGGATFGVVPKKIWSKTYPADIDNLCNWAMRCMLVVDGNRRILIDTGIGNKQDDKFFSHFFLNGDANLDKSLKTRGYSPKDITDVILTHLHFDHCGGSIRYNEKKELVPTFPNASYHISRQQWECALKPNSREKASYLKENIEPILQSGQLQLLDKEQELFPNFYVKLFNGHTQGQIIPHINCNGRTVVFCADLFPSVAHLPLLFIMSFDVRPLETIEERKHFFTEAIKNDYILFFEHDLYHECCTLQETEKGARAKSTFTLNDFFSRK